MVARTVHSVRSLRFLISIAFLLVMALADSSVAFADSTTGTASVAAGTLTETNGTTPAPGLTLNGTDQTVTYTMAIHHHRRSWLWKWIEPDCHFDAIHNRWW